MKRLRLGLTAFNTFITCGVLLCMTLLCAGLSERNSRAEAFRNFGSQLSTAAAYLQNQDRLSLNWLTQLEAAGNLHTAISDEGRPLYSAGLDPDRGGSAVTQAREIARQEQGYPEKNRLFTCAFPMRTADGRSYYAGMAKIPKGRGSLELTLLYPLDSLEARLCHQRLAVGLGTLLAMGLLGGFSWVFTGKLLRPIEESQRQEKAFIAAASHELRTPLTAILSAASAMERAEGPEKETFSQVIHREGKRMGRLIEDMLTLASADSGGWQVRPQRIEPDMLALESYEAYAPQAKAKGLKMNLEIPQEVPAIFADPDRVSQALSILLDNAISCTPPPGHITLGVSSQGRYLRFTVADTGPGVPEGDKERIFRRFYRGEKARTDKSHFGLGLSIAAEIAAKHGGKLWVEDNPTGGAVFILELPLR
mgnify:FL=1